MLEFVFNKYVKYKALFHSLPEIHKQYDSNNVKPTETLENQIEKCHVTSHDLKLLHIESFLVAEF